MKAKKFLSTAVASAMVFSTLYGIPVMADEIDGDTIFVETEVIDVTLPTTASQKFYVDPQGLIAVGKGGSATANAGTVTGTTAMYAVNRSSIPLALSVSYKLVDSAEADGVTVVSTVADEGAAVKAATDKSIAVSVTAKQSATDGSVTDYAGKVYKDNAEAGIDMGTATALTTGDVVYAGAEATKAAYIMKGATYEFKRKAGKTEADAYDSSAYEYVMGADNDASCLELKIAGYCSTAADWSAYASGTETLKLDVLFKFVKVSSEKGDNTDVKAGDEEVELGPKVTVTSGGLITCTGMEPGKLFASLRIQGDGDDQQVYVLNVGEHTFSDYQYDDAEGGSFKLQLNETWTSYYTGQTVTVWLYTTDDKMVQGSATFD